ncbi:MAG: hypothetical protein U0L49_03830 [Eubacterium sp.]|nr:hypothetical protein [Eubacterium sp.]
MYKKPMIIKTDEMTEGIFLASGTASAAGGYEVGPVNGNQHTFTFKVPDEYSHFKMTVKYSAAISSTWASASSSVNGDTAVYEVWSHVDTLTVTAVYDGNLTVSSVKFQSV